MSSFSIPPAAAAADEYAMRLALDQAVKDNGTRFDAGYVYISGFTPMERRDEIWSQVKKANPGIVEKARFGTLNPPIANSVADQASAVLRANPDISVIFAPKRRIKSSATVRPMPPKPQSPASRAARTPAPAAQPKAPPASAAAGSRSVSAWLSRGHPFGA